MNMFSKKLLFVIAFVSIAIIAGIVGYLYSSQSKPALAAGNIINATSCEQADVQTAINLAADGDTIVVPAGNCAWTTVGQIVINKQITLQGNGVDSTIIIVNGTAYRAAIIINANKVTIKAFTFISTDGSYAYPIQVQILASNFRIAYNKFTGTSGYAIDVRTAYGLIDHNSFTFTNGSSQPVNVRGPADSWQTASTIGGADNVFLEDNVFTYDNRGYPVCSTNARCVFRYNTMGPSQIDMHGECTGNPGVRHYEIYNNEWLDLPGYYKAFDIRGGTGRIFNNIATKTSGALWFNLDEHAANHTYCAGYSPNCGCSAPLNHQIGVGKDPKQRASEPLYVWGNKKNGVYWPASVYNDVALCATVSQCGVDFVMSSILTDGLDFVNSDAKPATMTDYIPYTYPHPLTIEAPPPLKGDFNSDKKVNDLDFTSFKNAFKSIFNSIFDLNSDSIIDVKDLGVLMNGWLP